MARSRRLTPIASLAAAVSEKEDKRHAPERKGDLDATVLYRARPGLPVAVPVDIALVEPVRRALARCCNACRIDLQPHQAAGNEDEHLAQGR